MRERKVNIRKYLYRCIILTVICLLLGGAGALAAEMTVTFCQIRAYDRGTVEVSACGSLPAAGTDGNYYLFALLPHETKITQNSIQAACVPQSGTLNFLVPLNLDSEDSLLYRKFVIATCQENKNKFKIVSNAMYITNPEVLAKYNYAFPKAASKKGLHIQPTMLTDAEDLRIRHAAVNICLDTFIASSGMQNAAQSYEYHYQGKTYWFTKYACTEVDTQVKKLSETGVVISGILLLRDQGAGSVLVPPKARGTGKPYYGFNTMNRQGTETLAALMSFLGERYMASNGENGRIVNWIVGNEVNYYGRYNYQGALSFEEYAEAYARGFRLVSAALHSVYAKARVYISLDHCWNLIQPDGQSYTSKKMLDAFAKELINTGDIPWNLAFHPYPAPLTDPAFWDDDNSYTDSTKTVTMNNIGYLTDYLTRNFRQDVRVILSEQGFTSQVGKKTQEKRQAAAFAYAYYITEFNDKIDAFIMNRHVDHQEEIAQGLKLGLWTTKKNKLEYAAKQKVIYDVFKYIDSASSKSVTQFALTYIHASSWASKIPGFTWNRFKKMGAYKQGTAAAATKIYNKKAVKNSLKYNYNGTVTKKSGGAVITVNTEANPNLYQGAGWTFVKKLNFSARPYFICRLKVTGMKEKYAHVRIRFFSGKNIYEAQTRIPRDQQKQLAVNLSKWSGRKSVDEIQIWVRPYNKTKWKSGGTITVSYMKQAKKTKK